MGRRIFIGDVQGCREELEELLEALRFDPAGDALHPVGDLVNRGPDSLGCLRLLRSLGAGGVLGNHDLHLLACRAGRRSLRPDDTLAPLLAAADAAELCAWLAERPFLRPFDDLLLVHAGLSPAWEDPEAALAGADPYRPSAAARFAVSVRTCAPDGRQPAPDADPDEPPYRPWHAYLEEMHLGGRTVVFGHWAARGLQRVPGALGLDTGCVWGGRLTAWVPEEDRIESVAAHRAYAPVR